MKETRKEMSMFLDRQEVRRKHGLFLRLKQLERVLISLVIVFVGFACLYGVYQMMFLGPTFSIRKIEVAGELKNISPDELIGLSGIKEGDNLFWVNVSGVHRQIIGNPWVKSVVVRRVLPSTLWIYVKEKEPLALILIGSDLYFVDEDGDPFKRAEYFEDKNLPVFTGLESMDNTPVGKDESQIKIMLSIANLFSKSEFGGSRDLAEIHFDVVKGYSIMTRKEPVTILLGHAAFEDAIARVEEMFTAISGRPGRIQYMLVSEPNKVVVGYQKGGAIWRNGTS